MASAFDNNIASPVLSPVNNEYSEAQLLDENSKVLDLVALVPVDASGHTNLGSAVYSTNGHKSQVTGLQQGSVVTAPGGEKIRPLGVVGLDTNGNPVPFKGSAKFASTVQTGTGASQNVAHGLGVIPSAVLVSVYDPDSLSEWTITEGAHDATNVKVTVTSGVKFKVLAFT